MACFHAASFFDRGHIRCCGHGCLWFRPYGESLFQTPKRNQKALLLRTALAGSGSFAPGSIPAQRLRFASLHLLPLCTTSSYGRCAPTPGSIPPLSLPMSLVRQDQGHSSFAHCNEWLEAWCLAWDLWCGCPSPQPSPEGEGADLWAFQNLSSTRYLSRRISHIDRGQSPLPPGGPTFREG